MAKGISRKLIPEDKVTEIRELFAQVNLSEVCTTVNVKQNRVYYTLNNRLTSLAAYADLLKVVEEARKVVAAKMELINSL